MLEMLNWSICLGLRVIWNINTVKRSSSFHDVFKWVKHHRKGLPRILRIGTACESLTRNLILVMENCGLITCFFQRGKRRKLIQKSNLVIIPRVKVLNIILSPNSSTPIHNLTSYKDVYEWLHQDSETYRNIRIVFPSLSKEAQTQLAEGTQEVQTQIAEIDEDYKTALTQNAIRLWKETKDLAYFEKIEKRKEAILELKSAIAIYGSDLTSCPFLHSKLAKWEGILLSQEGKWESALKRFREGLSLAETYIAPEIDWFEAAIAETEAWVKLKDYLIEGLADPFSEVIPNLVKARLLYEKSKDAPSRDFIDYWIRLFDSLKSGVLTDYSLYKRISQYIERDSPRAIKRKKIVDPLGTFSVLKPLLMYNELERTAQVFESGLNSLLFKYCGETRKMHIDTAIRIAKANLTPSPKLEWLVKNNTIKKHLTSERLEKARHIHEVDRDSGQLANIEVEIGTYLASLEKKLKGPSERSRA